MPSHLITSCMALRGNEHGPGLRHVACDFACGDVSTHIGSYGMPVTTPTYTRPNALPGDCGHVSVQLGLRE